MFTVRYELFNYNSDKFGQSGTGTGFSVSIPVFPCQYHSTRAVLVFAYMLLLRGRQTGEVWESSKMQLSSGNWRAPGGRVIPLSSLNAYAAADQYVCTSICRRNLLKAATERYKI